MTPSGPPPSSSSPRRTVRSGSGMSWCGRRWRRARPRAGPRLLHRQAGRVLAQRPAVDPATVAYHARLGGDVELASRALADAAARAAERFDHAAAEALLDDALSLHPEPESWLARARVAHPPRALPRGPAATSSSPRRPARPRWRWARGRPTSTGTSPRPPSSRRTARWPRPTRRPGPGASRSVAAPATPPVTWPRRSCCSVRRSRSPRARTGSPRPPGWGCSGPIRAGWMRRCRCCARRPGGRWGWSTPPPPCTRSCSPGTRTHWRARRRLALAAFARYTAEVERRQVPRFAGRAVNFAGWVLRNLGARAGSARPPHRSAGGGAAPGHRGGHHRRPGGSRRAVPGRRRCGRRAGRGWRRRWRCCGATWFSGGGWS